MLLAFLGVCVSVITQWVKSKTTLHPTTVAVLLSVLASIGVATLNHFGYWQAVLGILTTAGAFYAFIIRNVQE